MSDIAERPWQNDPVSLGSPHKANKNYKVLAEKLAEVLREAREVIAEEYGDTVASCSPLVHRIDAALEKWQEGQ